MQCNSVTFQHYLMKKMHQNTRTFYVFLLFRDAHNCFALKKYTPYSNYALQRSGTRIPPANIQLYFSDCQCFCLKLPIQSLPSADFYIKCSSNKCFNFTFYYPVRPSSWPDSSSVNILTLLFRRCISMYKAMASEIPLSLCDRECFERLCIFNEQEKSKTKEHLGPSYITKRAYLLTH